MCEAPRANIIPSIALGASACYDLSANVILEVFEPVFRSRMMPKAKRAIRTNRQGLLRGIEPLETRDLMSGNQVSATLLNGSLTVAGTTSDDTIDIRQVGNELLVRSATREAGKMIGSSQDEFSVPQVQELIVSDPVGNNSIRFQGISGGNSFSVILAGGSGNDTLACIDADATLIPGSGSNSLYGEGGVVTVNYGNLTTGIHADLLRHTVAHNGTSDLDHLNGIVNLIGSSFDDYVEGVRSGSRIQEYVGNNHLVGFSGDNVLIGGSGNDTIDAGSGSDWIETTAGADTVNVGVGSATITGGTGNDTVIGGSGPAVITAGRGPLSVVGGTGDLQIFGGPGGDSLIGGTGHNYIIAGTGNTKIVGGPGSDVLVGGPGDDSIMGGGGDDVIMGGGGNDQLSESDSPDPPSQHSILLGGAGTNTITNQNANAIVSRVSTQDTITSGAGLTQYVDDTAAPILTSDAASVSSLKTWLTNQIDANQTATATVLQQSQHDTKQVSAAESTTTAGVNQAIDLSSKLDDFNREFNRLTTEMQTYADKVKADGTITIPPIGKVPSPAALLDSQVIIDDQGKLNTLVSDFQNNFFNESLFLGVPSLKDIETKAGGVVTTVTNGVSNVINVIGNGIHSVGDLANSIISGVEDIGQDIGKAATAASTAISTSFTPVLDILQSDVSSAISAAMQAIGGLSNALSNLKIDIHVSTADLKNINVPGLFKAAYDDVLKAHIPSLPVLLGNGIDWIADHVNDDAIKFKAWWGQNVSGPAGVNEQSLEGYEHHAEDQWHIYWNHGRRLHVHIGDYADIQEISVAPAANGQYTIAATVDNTSGMDHVDLLQNGAVVAHFEGAEGSPSVTLSQGAPGSTAIVGASLEDDHQHFSKFGTVTFPVTEKTIIAGGSTSSPPSARRTAGDVLQSDNPDYFIDHVTIEDDGDTYVVIVDSPAVNPDLSIAVTATFESGRLQFNFDTGTKDSPSVTSIAHGLDGTLRRFTFEKDYDGNTDTFASSSVSVVLTFNGLSLSGDQHSISPREVAVNENSGKITSDPELYEFPQKYSDLSFSRDEAAVLGYVLGADLELAKAGVEAIQQMIGGAGSAKDFAKALESVKEFADFMAEKVVDFALDKVADLHGGVGIEKVSELTFDYIGKNRLQLLPDEIIGNFLHGNLSPNRIGLDGTKNLTPPTRGSENWQFWIAFRNDIRMYLKTHP